MIGRFFLGLSEPPLQRASTWFSEHFSTASELDLSQVLVVLPGARAANRLLQLLVSQAEQNGRVFNPPTITTIGEFPECLYQSDKPFASEMAMQIAWSQATRQTPLQELNQVVGRRVGSVFEAWQPLAKTLASLHRRLANDSLTFQSVAETMRGFDDLKEEKRWIALEKIQERYFDLLKSVNLLDRQAARNVAVLNKACQTDKQIVMVGTPDLNRGIREMLTQLETQVTSLIAAPSEWADRFDTFGSLVTERWLDDQSDMPDSKIKIVDRPEDQAFAVADYLAQVGESFTPDQVTIGVPDESVIPQIERTFNALGIEHRNLRGRPLIDSGPVRLLAAAQDYLESESYDSFAALVRHPDIFIWLTQIVGSSSWLADLDHFQNSNLPDGIPILERQPFGDPTLIAERYVLEDEKSQARAKQLSEATRILNHVHSCISERLEPLQGNPQPIAHWTKPWAQWLLAVYGGRTMDQDRSDDRRTIRACKQLYEALADNQQIPESWGARETAARALALAIEIAADGSVASSSNPSAVELVGWLDLALDDAAVVVVTGMNDEYVPASENGHVFLPNSLCEKLGILDNHRRYARDAYVLSIVTGVRENFLLIVGRRDRDGEPQKPSRLLFVADRLTIARRAKAFFEYNGNSASRYWLADPAQLADSQQFKVPRPLNPEGLDNLTVTSFREYIKCPYRFYLSKVMRLESVEDSWRELDARAFGNLAHDVLEEFGNSEIRDSCEAPVIAEFLSNALDKWQNIRYRGSRLPAVRIQVEQLRYRLDRFAELQAQRAAEGWRIVAVEQYREHQMLVDGRPFTIRGTIDRVDVNDRLGGKIAIWDYKTSDAGKSPTAVHYSKSKGWTDLQLPLYRYLAREIESLNGYDLDVPNLGYVALPKSVKQIKFQRADWGRAELADADQATEEVIRSLQQGVFWPPAEVPPIYSDDWAAICHDHVFEKCEFLDSSGGSA